MEFLENLVFSLQTKWMMYWIVFALFQAVETFTDTFLAWLALTVLVVSFPPGLYAAVSLACSIEKQVERGYCRCLLFPA